MTSRGGFDRFRDGISLPGGRTLPGVGTFGPWHLILLILAMILGGLGGYWGFTHFYEASHAPAQVGTPARVVRTTIRNTVSATGTVAATEQTSLTFQATGQITQIFVKAGDRVPVGQPIAGLDSRAATIARDSARSSLASAQAKLDALFATQLSDAVAAQQSVASAQAGVTTAQATLTKSQNDFTSLMATQPSTAKQLQASLDKATSDLRTAQTNYDKLVGRSDLATRSEVTTLTNAKQLFEAAQANLLSKLTPPLSTDVAQAQTNLKLARDALQAASLRSLQVQADPTAATSDKLAAQNAVSAAQAQVDAAQSNIQKLQQGTDQTNIAAAQAQLDNARASLQSAQTNYNNLIALSDLVSRPEFAALAAASSSYQTARSSYDSALGTQDADLGSSVAAVQAGQAGVPSAQASLDSAQAKRTALNVTQQTDLSQATEVVNSAQLALQQAQLTLDNQTLRAPFSGVIISVPVAIGQQVSATTAITTLTNPDALEVDANVDETSVTQLRAGQPATVTMDALPGRTFNASVAAVTPSGTTQQGVVVFPIVFRLDTQGAAVPAGASANITVVTSVTPNVLAVPARYVHRQGANQVVDVLVNNKREFKVVATGVTNGQLTEITSGLQVGDIAIPPEQNRQGATFGAGGNVGGGGVTVVR